MSLTILVLNLIILYHPITTLFLNLLSYFSTILVLNLLSYHSSSEHLVLYYPSPEHPSYPAVQPQSPEHPSHPSVHPPDHPVLCNLIVNQLSIVCLWNYWLARISKCEASRWPTSSHYFISSSLPSAFFVCWSHLQQRGTQVQVGPDLRVLKNLTFNGGPSWPRKTLIYLHFNYLHTWRP